MYLFRLIYYSRNIIRPEKGPVTDQLRAILDQCRRNNPPLGITGAMIFDGAYFAQVLEGDRKAVTELFCRIANDPRNTDPVILEATAISERRFTDWMMGFAGHSADLDPIYVRYGSKAEFNPAKMTAEALLGFVVELSSKDMRGPRVQIDGHGEPSQPTPEAA